MKSMMKILGATAIVAMVLFACKKDDPVDTCAGFNFATELQAETNAVIAAANAYGTNPTTENCNAYRTAYQNYLNAASDLQACANATGQGTEYAQAIAEAQAQLDALQC